MKKLTLLCLTTILVIGIQGCSTDDKLVNQGDEIPKDVIKFTNGISQKLSGSNSSTSFKRMLVYYKGGGSDEENISYVKSSLKTTFSTILVGLQSYCNNSVYEWYVPTNELPDYYCSNKCGGLTIFPKTDGEGTATHKTELKQLGSDNDEGDPACKLICRGYSSYGWINDSNPSCVTIQNYFSYK